MESNGNHFFFFIGQSGFYRGTALTAAIVGGDVEVTKYLLCKGASLEAARESVRRLTPWWEQFQAQVATPEIMAAISDAESRKCE